jgi:hypothetical protein
VSALTELWQFGHDNHETLEALATAAASLFAFFGLLVSAAALVGQTRALDAANYLEARKLFAEAQRKVQAAAKAADTQLLDFEWIELLNLGEALADLYRQKRLGRATRKSVKSDLVGLLNAIDNAPGAKEAMVKAFTHPSAFQALRWFRAKYAREIARYA